MTPRRRWTLAACGVTIALALTWAFVPRPVDVEAAAVTTGRFVQTVEEDGRTRLRDRYVVSASVAGRLLRPALREGDAVSAGDVLARIVPSAAPMLDERTARESLTRVAGAQAQRAAADARAARAAVAVEQALAEQQRSEALAGEGFLSANRLETARLALRAAQREADAARQERLVAEQALRQARIAAGVDTPGADGAARDPAVNRGGAVVRAPVAGHVLRVLHASEGPVAAGTPLFELGDLGSLEVVAELLTPDALRAPAGTPARIERWGGPDTLEGRVERIEPAAFTKVSALGVEEQRVLAVVSITSPRTAWQALGDGYRVGVSLQVRVVERARLVPSSAVFPHPAGDGPGRHAVFIIDAGRARLQPVTVGARQAGLTWLTEGPPDGTSVIVYPPATVVDAARVQVRPR